MKEEKTSKMLFFYFRQIIIGDLSNRSNKYNAEFTELTKFLKQKILKLNNVL